MAPISWAQLSSAQLIGANFNHAVLAEGHFAGAGLVASNLTEVDARGADFHDADLTGSHLAGGRFQGASFRGATLTAADLSRGQFAGADFHDAEMQGARLFGADLSGARGLTQGQVESSCTDGSTRLPGGLWATKGCHIPIGLHFHMPGMPTLPPTPVAAH